MEAIAAMQPEELCVVFPLIFEELGWGDAGLAISAAAGILPAYMSAKFGRLDLLQKYPDTLLGCWAITEPNHGSDSLDASKQIFHAAGNYGRPDRSARITDGKVIINGQKSAWVSNAPVADVAILYCAAETDDGLDPHRGAVLLVPMGADGLTHRVLAHNFLQPLPALQAAMFTKVTATQNAFEVASEAIQIFGGNGVTYEYPVEKIFRDARSSLIEDGCNEILSIKGDMNMIDEGLL
jgi:alkylation response protein AidB-like acyl-CoA dehydrogenase